MLYNLIIVKLLYDSYSITEEPVTSIAIPPLLNFIFISSHACVWSLCQPTPKGPQKVKTALCANLPSIDTHCTFVLFYFNHIILYIMNCIVLVGNIHSYSYSYSYTAKIISAVCNIPWRLFPRCASQCGDYLCTHNRGDDLHVVQHTA